MTVKFSPWGNSQFVDSTGAPASGYKIYTYAAGSSTPQTTYTDSAGGTAQSNPIILNSLGLPTTGQIWLTSGQNYKLVWTDANDVVKKTEDNISGVNDTGSTTDQWVASGISPTYVSATQFTMAGDQTSAFTVGRRCKFTVTAGTVYGRISVSAFAAVTTVTMVMDASGNLDSGLSAVSYGILTPTNNSFPDLIQAGAGISKTFDTSGRPVISAAGPTASNVGFAFSVGSSALTITLTQADGATAPSSSAPASVPFRSATAATGDVTTLSITATQSLTISSGSTLGTSNSTAFRGWIVGFNDAGTFRLGVINCLSGTAPSYSIYPLAQFGIASSTAEGGAGAADSAGVFYTGTAVTSKAYTVLGYFTYESGLGTAGTWASVPTRGQVFIQGTPLPGYRIQTSRSQTGAVATGSTALPYDDTIPQNTEGDQFLSQAITPSSAANLLQIKASLMLANGGGAARESVAIFQDSTANALAAAESDTTAANFVACIPIEHNMLAATTSSTTFKVRAGSNGGGTTTFNGTGGVRTYGGVFSSFLSIDEVMA